MKSIHHRLLVLVLLPVFSGCSVFMAMHGKKEPNMAVLSVGQDRGIVILNLGNPTQTYIKDGMTVDVYDVQFGNAPSGGRAVGHAVMDLLTFGGWEIIGTPIEGVQGESKSITIQYDKDNKLVSVDSIKGTTVKEKRDEKVEDNAPAPESATNFTHK